MFHLCRTFEDPEITHVEGEVDPVRDLDIINEELRLKDEEFFEKIFEEVEKKFARWRLSQKPSCCKSVLQGRR